MLDTQQTAQVADEGGLAVHERVDTALGEVEGAHGGDQDRAHGLVPPVQPVHVDARAALQLQLVLGAADLDEHVGGGVRGQRLHGGGDGGQGALVPGQQVPVGPGVGGVGAAGTHQAQPVARPGARRPHPGQSGAAVVDEVEGEPPGLGVPVAHGVGAGDRPLLAGALGAHALQVEGLGVAGRGRGEEQLDVAVGVPVGGERVQALPAQDDPDHVRGDLLDRLDPSGVDGPGPSLPLCHGALFLPG